jgi:hypothetical protein
MKIAVIAVLSFSLALGGCTTTRDIWLPQSPDAGPPRVGVGESVLVRMKSTQQLRMKVQAVDARTLTGASLDPPRGRVIQIDLADVESMSARRFNGGRTLGLVAGVAAGVVLLTFAGMYAAVTTCEDCTDP